MEVVCAQLLLQLAKGLRSAPHFIQSAMPLWPTCIRLICCLQNFPNRPAAPLRISLPLHPRPLPTFSLTNTQILHGPMTTAIVDAPDKGYVLQSALQ